MHTCISIYHYLHVSNPFTKYFLLFKHRNIEDNEYLYFSSMCRDLVMLCIGWVMECSDWVMMCSERVILCCDWVITCSDWAMLCSDWVMMCSDWVITCSDWEISCSDWFRWVVDRLQIELCCVGTYTFERTHSLKLLSAIMKSTLLPPPLPRPPLYIFSKL